MLRAWILALSPKTASSSGWVDAGLAAPLSHAANPARQPCGAAYAGTQARSAGESVVTSGSSVTASAAASGAGTTVVGIVPSLPCRFRSNSAWQFMFSTGGAGVEATNRAPTGHLAVLAAA
jgi:hypothetical protein